MKSNAQKKGRHSGGKKARVENSKIWEQVKSEVVTRSGKFSPEKLQLAITKFKNARPFKPSGKKPISRPK